MKENAPNYRVISSACTSIFLSYVVQKFQIFCLLDSSYNLYGWKWVLHQISQVLNQS